MTHLIAGIPTDDPPYIALRMVTTYGGALFNQHNRSPDIPYY